MVYARIVGVAMLLCTGVHVHAQQVRANTQMRILPGTIVSTAEDIEIANNAVLINEGTIVFSENFYNSGERFVGGDLIAEGNSQQTIGGSDSIAFNNLSINNRSGVLLVSTASLSGNLTLKRGVLSMGDDDMLHFLQTAASPIEHRDGYIHGTAVMNSRPVGSGELRFLGVRITDGEDLGDVKLIRNTGDDAILAIGDGLSLAGNWEIETTEKNVSGRDVTFSWIDVFDNGLDIENVSLYGNVDFDTTRFVKLDNRLFGRYPLTYYPTTGLRTYTRYQLDHVDRTYTIADLLAQSGTVEPTSITAFPNPATDHINLLLENYEIFTTHVVVRVADATGKVFFKNAYPVNGNVIRVDGLEALPQGLYRIFISRGSRMQMVSFSKF